ncbi:hypothetical protein QBC45DRAFT_338648, partial [Copromyces sp. CBS 386.78]
KFYIDSFAMSDIEVQFYYLFAYLLPTVKKPLIAFINIRNRTPEKFIEKFKLTYSNPNIIKKIN